MEHPAGCFFVRGDECGRHLALCHAITPCGVERNGVMMGERNRENKGK